MAGGIFAALTGSASRNAARKNEQAIGAGLGLGANALTTGANNATGYLGLANGGDALQSLGQGYSDAYNAAQTQYGQTQGYLGGAGSQAQGLLGAAGDQGRADLLGGFGAAGNALSSAYGTQAGLLGQATGLYDRMAQGGRGAYDAYLNATGANGAAGSEAATAAFREAPGYGYARDQALEAIQRSAAARGGLAGGNATAEILRTATGLADQGYQQYVNNLGNAAGSYGTALAGQAAGLGAQANAAGAYGSAQAGLNQAQGTALSSLAQQVAQNRANAAQTTGAAQGQAAQNMGTTLGSLATTLGQNRANVFGQGAGIQSQFGRDVAGLQTNAAGQLVQNNNNLAQAQNQASANVIGLGQSLLGGLSNFASGGGLARLGGLFS